MKLSKFFIAFGLFFSTINLLHAGLDPQDIEMLTVAKEQLKNLKHLKEQYKKEFDTLTQQKKVLEDSQKMMQGHYGYSSLHNNANLTDWQYSGKDLSSLLNSQNGTGSLSNLSKQIEKDFPLKASGEIFNNKASEQAKLFDLIAKTTLASRASSTLAYNNMDAELTLLDALQKEIEQSPNQKATLDLMARIQIEQAKLVAYQIKSNAVNTQLTSLGTQQEVSDTKWASNFFQWH